MLILSVLNESLQYARPFTKGGLMCSHLDCSHMGSSQVIEGGRLKANAQLYMVHGYTGGTGDQTM